MYANTHYVLFAMLILNMHYYYIQVQLYLMSMHIIYYLQCKLYSMSMHTMQCQLILSVKAHYVLNAMSMCMMFPRPVL